MNAVMKKVILMTFVLLGATLSYAQKKVKEKDVPQAAKDTFKKKYPRATDPEWRTAGDNAYDVDYETGNRVYISKFSADGKWIETETDVTLGSLPKPVRDEWKKSAHKDWEVLYVVKVEAADTTAKPKVYYQIAVKKAREMKGVLIAADGKKSLTEDIK